MTTALQDIKGLVLTAIKPAPQAGLITASIVDTLNMVEELAIPGNLEMASMIKGCSRDVRRSMAKATVRRMERLFTLNARAATITSDAVSAGRRSLTVIKRV